MTTFRIPLSATIATSVASRTAPAVARRIVTVALALTIWIGATNPAHAQALIGSGTHLPLSGNARPTTVGPAYVTNGNISFTATWSTPAQPAWLGTFTGTGPTPAGTSTPAGLTSYDFSGLATNLLPANTHFHISDLDNGSGTEQITLVAYGLGRTLITSPWLASPILGEAGTTNVNDMPGWSWNMTTGAYIFDGTTVPGNPTVGFVLGSNQGIYFLEVTRGSINANFSLGAPSISAIPEPSTYAAIAGAAMLGLAVWQRRRRQISAAIAAT